MNIKPRVLLVCFIALQTGIGRVPATEYFVSTKGNDLNPGTRKSPLRSIQRGSELAKPGDTVTVLAGIYRERINPPRGGASDRNRITYQGAAGEHVEIRGSEVVTNWILVQGNVWKAVLPNSFFGEFNPYKDLLHGDWFDPKGRQHHTGAVYLNGNWLVEAAKLDEVLSPPGTRTSWLKDWDEPNLPQLWFSEVDSATTTIWAQFAGMNPNEQLVEINARRTVFYPDRPGRNYITVRNFTLKQAATPWAPPTAEQIGLMGTHWSKGWIIENNVISHSICSGVALGKYGDAWDNTSANTAEGYVKTIERALQNGWNAQTVGHHIVRNNTISHCEQTGIVGSLGAAFCTINGNTIHDIHVRGLFTGAEMAGIKFHGAIDTVISGNHIYRTCRGLWLDWMAQGTRVTRNLFHDNAGQDVFVEVDHGPFVMDNNLFFSQVSLLDISEGGAYAHNLFAGRIISRPEPSRQTPYHPAHSTQMSGLAEIKGGDNRFYNNIFVGPSGGVAKATSENLAHEVGTRPKEKDPEWGGGFGLWVYNFREQPIYVGGNVFYYGAQPYAKGVETSIPEAKDPHLKLVQEAKTFTLQISLGRELEQTITTPVTSERLGRAKIPQLGYEDPPGSPLKMDVDYSGKRRNKKHPTPGPFENPGSGDRRLELK